MKIVLDTNVIILGLISPFGPSAEIIRLVISENIWLCYDARIISEYKEVLFMPKFSFDPQDVNSFLAQIERCGFAAACAPLVKKLSDPDDEPFLEVAVSAKAGYLVTGNLKHYPPNKYQNVTIISPTKFLEIYRWNK